jgi:hypothetical protein
MNEKPVEVWDLIYPKAGATGIPFARGRIEAQEVILVHAAPEVLTVQVFTGDGALKAQGEDLRAQAETPITRLTCSAGKIEREDIWPKADSVGLIVLLPGGEAGVLKSWWHAPDHSEWRWTVEFYNHKG